MQKPTQNRRSNTAVVRIALGIILSASIGFAQDAPVPRADVFADRPRFDVATSITLEEARIIIEAAAALVPRRQAG